MAIVLNKPIAPNLAKLTNYLEQVNESGWYTNFGPLHQLLTKRLEHYLGVENLLLVSNGTLAIQVACKVLNIQSALTTPFTFVATSSAMLWQGIDVAFCDIDRSSYNLCAKKVESALQQDHSYDAIMATHVYGNPCDVVAIQSVADKFGKKVIYDAAHAFGVKVGDKSVLNYGDASTLSFHATKVFHTAEGGAIVFKRKADYEKAKSLINFGIQSDGSLGEAGINAKLNEYQCAVGLTLLDNIEQILDQRIALFQLYCQELQGVVELPSWHEQANFNGAYMPILPKDSSESEAIIKHLQDHDIQSRKYFSPSLDQAYTHLKNFGCKVSHQTANKVVCLPLHAFLTKEDVIAVTSKIKEVLK